jgi:hypothetical protein
MKYHVDVNYLFAEVEAESEEEARNKVCDILEAGFGDSIADWDIGKAWLTELVDEKPTSHKPTMQELEDFFLER